MREEIRMRESGDRSPVPRTAVALMLGALATPIPLTGGGSCGIVAIWTGPRKQPRRGW
jgi:hypothetical protein